MSNEAKRECLDAIRERYRVASKPTKRIILEEFCSTCGHHRKYAISLLNARPNLQGERHRQRPGPRPKYQDPAVRDALVFLWEASEGHDTLVAFVLPKPLKDEVKHLLMTIAAATNDRFLRPLRLRYCKYGLATTKPRLTDQETHPHQDQPMG